MKIKRLEINSFGKLKNVNISIDERVTVITGKNEAGKSTIASFIKYMLYGFTSSRNANLSENDKKKYRCSKNFTVFKWRVCVKCIFV